MQYWWVNQNQTYIFEVPGGYMWSPKANTNGAYNQFYENMRDVSPGDVVFSFKDTLIKAVGIATGHAETAAKPTEFSVVDNPWSQEGWFVPVSFTELEKPIRPKSNIDLLRPYLPTKYAPLQSNGNGLQAVYLANVPSGMADVLITLLEGQVESIVMAGFEEGELLDELGNPSPIGWHTFGMEWKQHVAWLAPMLATLVAYVALRYGPALAYEEHLYRRCPQRMLIAS